MSPEEVIFQSNVLIRHILNNLIDGKTNLLSIALINKKFYDETCSRLRQIQDIRFETSIKLIRPELLFPSTSSSDDDADEKKEMVFEPIEKIGIGFNGIIAEDLPTFESNLKFVSKQSSATSLDVRELRSYRFLELDPLLQLDGIDTLIFHPSQRCACKQVFFKLIEKNLFKLRKLVHPPEDFLKALLPDDALLDLDFLEVDLKVFRSMCNGIRDGENVYIFQAKDEFDEILRKKIKVKSLILYGHNRVRFQSFFQTLLAESNASSLKMVAEEPQCFNEDLMIFQEWKNRNKSFHKIREFELIFWHDTLRTEYDTAVPLLLEVFPHLSKLTFGSQKSSSADECMGMLDSVHSYWKKNIHQQKFQHCINISAIIPKEQRSNFELRLMNHKSYRSLSKSSSDIWTFSMRINYFDEILFNFNIL